MPVPSPFDVRLAIVDAEHWNATGAECARVGHLHDAEQRLRKAVQLAPQGSHVAHQARFNLGLVLLLTGDYEAGLALFEHRHHVGQDERPALPPDFAPWNGAPLAGRSLLVIREQGHGDEIQMVRYLPLLAAQGATRITYVCGDALYPLLRCLDGDGDGVRILPRSSTTSIEPHDFWIMAMSLPWATATRPDNIPASLPYLQVAATRVADWAQTLAAGPGLRIGLCWKGSAVHGNDRERPQPAGGAARVNASDCHRC